MKAKKSKALIVSTVLGILYAVYLIIYFAGASSEDLGGVLATTIVLPHMICTVIAASFNLAATLTNKRGFALTSGILYSVAAVVFVVYAVFLIPMIILSFIGFVNLKKLNEEVSVI